MTQRQHKHHIDVQTDEEIVTVTIGSDGGIPGGFAKLFNRVVDSEAWARLSDAGRAAYLPLVRFADHRNQFRVQLGRAAMMKYTGLSQSSVKRAIKDLIANKLVVLIEQGGVNARGENESNAYQLLVPTETRRQPAVSSMANPPGVQSRTPSRTPVEPPAGPLPDRATGQDRTATGDHRPASGGFASGPQLRRIDKENSKTALPMTVAARLPAEPTPVEHAAALLEEKGVEPHVARQLSIDFSHERIVDVVATMEWRRARGKCDNPGGFIREALLKQWQTPKAVVDARTKAEARAKAEERDRHQRAAARQQVAAADQEESRVERLIAALDDDELQILAQSVVEKYEGNTAVIGVLTRKPPRECRLMKMEIAAMMG